jgi:hypothetical protein
MASDQELTGQSIGRLLFKRVEVIYSKGVFYKQEFTWLMDTVCEGLYMVTVVARFMALS